jgi:putative transposase
VRVCFPVSAPGFVNSLIGLGPGLEVAGPGTRDAKSAKELTPAAGPACAVDACVSTPRQVIPGRTYLISRRCTQRQYLLRPDARVVLIYLYCLAEAAVRYGITVHAWIAMSNHHHLLVRDERGNFPAFLAHLHKMIAKAMNAYRGRWENFWATEQPSAVYLVEASDRFDKLVYLLANPVADDLVDRVADWPGASSFAVNLSGRVLRLKRPRGFFREDGPMPQEVELRTERLEGFAHLTDDEWTAKIAAAVDDAERAARARRREKCSRVFGRKNVLNTAPDARPSTTEPRRGLRPCVACRDSTVRAVELAVLRGFRVAYRVALRLWRAGARDTLFPDGTYRMRWFGVLTVSEAPAAPA